VRYPPEAIGAAIRNAGRHFASQWRIAPLWILKVCEENPRFPRLYLIAFVGLTLLISILKFARH
jgi:hypothetical protein